MTLVSNRLYSHFRAVLLLLRCRRAIDAGEGGDDARDKRVKRPHVSRQATGEEKDDLEHDGETLDEKSERPSLEAIEFALAVATALDRRSASVPEYLFNHCLPNIVTNAANSDINRLAYRKSEVVMISGEVHSMPEEWQDPRRERWIGRG